jgi:hypothetical protein
VVRMSANILRVSRGVNKRHDIIGIFGADMEKRVGINGLEDRPDLTFNHGVVGSIPTALTNLIKGLARDFHPAWQRRLPVSPSPHRAGEALCRYRATR